MKQCAAELSIKWTLARNGKVLNRQPIFLSIYKILNLILKTNF